MPDGSTSIYAVLGDPVAQVRAPALMNAWFAAHGVPAVMVALHTPAGRFSPIFQALRDIQNVKGLLVTVPHKFEAAACADHRSAAVDLIGTANALRRESDGSWTADNFDGAGFVDGLIKQGHNPEGMNVMLTGAGGAGCAIALALLHARVATLVILDEDAAKSGALLAKLDSRAPGIAVAGRTDGSMEWDRFDLAINATPAGMRPGDPLPFRPEALGRQTVVADIIMKPHETDLLRRAKLLGLQVHHGIHMLDCQIESYIRFFREPA